jgi:restriction endonuclease S subunit
MILDRNISNSIEKWETVKLEDVCEISSGGTPSRGVREYYGGNILWAKIEDLTRAGMWIETTSEKITELGLENSTAQIFPEKTVLFAMYASIGAASIAKVPIATNQAILGLQCSSKILPEYLWFWFTKVRTDLLLRGRGGTQANLSKSVVCQLELPLPSIETQRRIVAKLEAQMKAVEKARVALEEQLVSAQKLHGKYVTALFSNLDCKTGKLREVLTLRNSVIHPRDNPEGKAKFVGLEHIQSHTGKRLGHYDLDLENLTGRKPRFCKNDIVYGYLRPYLNKVWIAEFDGLCSVDQYAFSVNNQIALVPYVAAFMRSSVYLERAPINATPGQLPRIRTDEVLNVEIPLPSLDEQTQIIAKLERELNWSESLTKDLEQQLKTIQAIPAALLRQAFSGGVE